MTKAQEATGRDVAEAKRNALTKLGVTDDRVEITILDRGRRGFLGIIPARPARVRASTLITSRHRAEEIVSSLLRLMRFSTQLHITEDKNKLIVDIETAGADGLLIGKGGGTLSALEYIVNRMLQRENRRSAKVVLDVSGYKRRREDFLKAKALSLAKQVKSAGKQVTMEPLDAADRRIVHAVLKGDPSVETRSVGHGSVKSIVVAPAKPGSKTRGASRGGSRGRSRGGSRGGDRAPARARPTGAARRGSRGGSRRKKK
jgi:spoIIIJ-associated protein